MDIEPVASFARQNALSVITLAVVLYFGNGLEDDIDGVRAEINSMGNDIDDLRADIARNGAKIDDLRADIARNGTKIDDLRRQMYEEHTELRAAIAGFGERVVRVETITGVLEATVDKLESVIIGNTPESNRNSNSR